MKLWNWIKQIICNHNHWKHKYTTKPNEDFGDHYGYCIVVECLKCKIEKILSIPTKQKLGTKLSNGSWWVKCYVCKSLTTGSKNQKDALCDNCDYAIRHI